MWENICRQQHWVFPGDSDSWWTWLVHHCSLLKSIEQQLYMNVLQDMHACASQPGSSSCLWACLLGNTKQCSALSSLGHRSRYTCLHMLSMCYLCCCYEQYMTLSLIKPLLCIVCVRRTKNMTQIPKGGARATVAFSLFSIGLCWFPSSCMVDGILPNNHWSTLLSDKAKGNVKPLSTCDWEDWGWKLLLCLTQSCLCQCVFLQCAVYDAVLTCAYYFIFFYLVPI